jgi:ribosomal protein S26
VAATAVARTADPYGDTTVIDANAPRTNQSVVALVCLVALATGTPWLVAVMGAQLVIGLTLGRRYCLPCVLYFEVIQPRIGEGRIEDARPPRFANVVGAVFLGGATLAFALGAATVGWILTGIVAALAGLAALTGFCLGCAVYARVWGCETCA